MAKVETFADYEKEAKEALLERARASVAGLLTERLRELEAAKLVVKKLEDQYQKLLKTEVTVELAAELATRSERSGAGAAMAKILGIPHVKVGGGV